MGWELAGLTIARGQIQRFPSGAPKSEKDARARAKRFADESDVEMISPAKLATMQADSSRTSYLLDVRGPEEFVVGHYPGSINAPGGQLVQETDHWVAVRNAWIVLIDSDGVRARMAASWLRQMGHRSVFVVDGALPMTETESDATTGDVITAVEEISASALAVAKDCLVVDLARSIDFRENHIPGAVWAVRTRLDKLPELKSAKRVVLTSPDGILAKLAVAEVKALTSAPVLVLSGGTESWIRAAFATAADRFMPDDDECVDCYLRPFDRNHRVEEAMQDYLVWEVDLVKHIERDGTVRFGVERT
jgi:rhodanese-related sulfurtransferase